jgi:hypothetical protein
MKTHLQLSVILLPLILLAGCSDDVVTEPVSREPEGYPEPLVSDGAAGLDQLITNLGSSYLEMSYAEYEKILAADYVFRVDPAEVDITGTAELDASGDLSSAENMFSGEVGREPILDPVTRLPTGDFLEIPAIATISVDIDPAGPGWEEGRWGEYGMTWRRVYAVAMTVTHAASNRVDQVRGKSVFFAIADQETGRWQLRAWEDQGVDSEIVVRANDSTSVASLKSRYLY